ERLGGCRLRARDGGSATGDHRIGCGRGRPRGGGARPPTRKPRGPATEWLPASRSGPPPCNRLPEPLMLGDRADRDAPLGKNSTAMTVWVGNFSNRLAVRDAEDQRATARCGAVRPGGAQLVRDRVQPDGYCDRLGDMDLCDGDCLADASRLLGAA